jgi:ATP diphosphatase
MKVSVMNKQRPMDRLVEIMETLRNPDGGCPWDVEQTFKTIAPHTIEEAYEVADAIEQNDMDALKDELGDLLFQSVFHAQMAKELNAFSFDDVVIGIIEKMIRRHPHVFGNETITTADEQMSSWEDIKAVERASKSGPTDESALAGVAKGIPALKRAEKLQLRAARVGFDWPNVAPVMDKLREETVELQTEIDTNASGARLTDELGDLLFVCVNLARKLNIDAETALRGANAKFESRFRHMEGSIKDQGETMKDMHLGAMEDAWKATKRSLASQE